MIDPSSPLIDLVIKGSPYGLLLLAVYWFHGKLKETEQRLHDRDERRAVEIDQYIKLIKELAPVLAEVSFLLKECKTSIESAEKTMIELRNSPSERSNEASRRPGPHG